MRWESSVTRRLDMDTQKRPEMSPGVQRWRTIVLLALASAVVLMSAVNSVIPQLIRLGIYVRSSLELRMDEDLDKCLAAAIAGRYVVVVISLTYGPHGCRRSRSGGTAAFL